MIEAYKRKTNTECAVCSKPIYKRPSQIEMNKGQVYCSMACYGISCRKELPCLVCGKLILAGFNKKTCSRSCANRYRKSVEYKITGSRDKVKIQRKLKLKLLSERGKKCERCDYDKYEILQVHHKDRNRKNNKLENLSLICPNCHYEEHFLENSWLRNNLEKKSKMDILS